MQPDPAGIIDALGTATGGGAVGAIVILALAAMGGAGLTVWLVLRGRGGPKKTPAVTVEVGPKTKDWAREELRHHRANLAQHEGDKRRGEK